VAPETPEPVRSVTQEPAVAETIRRWEAFWALEDLGRPLWMVPTSPVLTAALTGAVPLPELFQNGETQLRAQLALLAFREAWEIGDDFVPHLQPQGGVTVFASAFGCRVDFFEHTLPWAHPVIGADDPPGKALELKAPEVTDGQLGEMLERTEHFVRETQGRYPVAMTDLQGPLDTAYLVWEPSAFLIAMQTNPREVHHLMRLTTDLIIRYVKEQRARSPEFLPCHFPPLWIPDGSGIAVSDDALAVLSPKLYREFGLPYVNELSEEFGGVMIHSCGRFVHQLENLSEVRDLRGINFGASEMPFEAVWERFGGRAAVIPHLGLNKDIRFESNRTYMEHVLKTADHSRGLCVLVAPDEGSTMGDPEARRAFVAEVEALLGGLA
jgi:uroporphyrinogen-III decarboxylase